MIGLRRVKLTPMIANIMMVVSFNDTTSSLIYCQFQPENTLHEIFDYITNHATATGYAILFDFDGYNLKIRTINTTTYNDVPFYFVFTEDTMNGASILWHLFNQTGTPFPTMVTYDADGNITDTTAVNSIDLTNVRSRKALHVHASFSNSMTRYLCISDDLYEIVSKYYEDNTHRSTFSLFFTTDDTQKITPCSAQILIELCYKIRH